MKAIILLAGKGSRIRKYTNIFPKCLIKVNNKTLLDRQIEILNKIGVKDVFGVTGFKSKKIKNKFLKKIYNYNYNHNEQLDSLFYSKRVLKENVLIIFGDTIFEKEILEDLIKEKKGNIILSVDTNWKQRYVNRIDHPYDQADKVKFNKMNYLMDIGKNIDFKKSNAEFLGIMKLNNQGCNIFKKEYEKLKNKFDTSNLQVHNFIKHLIKQNIRIHVNKTKRKYMEIDTLNDLKIAKKIFNNN